VRLQGSNLKSLSPSGYDMDDCKDSLIGFSGRNAAAKDLKKGRCFRKTPFGGLKTNSKKLVFILLFTSILGATTELVVAEFSTQSDFNRAIPLGTPAWTQSTQP